MKKKKIINLFGGPHAGKSTLAYGLTYHLKLLHENVELCSEFAKDLVYENRHDALKCQQFIYGEQLRRLTMILNHVDIVITDCPILLGCVYVSNKIKSKTSFIKHVVAEHKYHEKEYDVVNLVIERSLKRYSEIGRIHGITEAMKIDEAINRLFLNYNIPHQKIDQTTSIDHIIKECILNDKNG